MLSGWFSFSDPRYSIFSSTTRTQNATLRFLQAGDEYDQTDRRLGKVDYRVKLPYFGVSTRLLFAGSYMQASTLCSAQRHSPLAISILCRSLSSVGPERNGLESVDMQTMHLHGESKPIVRCTFTYIKLGSTPNGADPMVEWWSGILFIVY